MTPKKSTAGLYFYSLAEIRVSKGTAKKGLREKPEKGPKHSEKGMLAQFKKKIIIKKNTKVKIKVKILFDQDSSFEEKLAL